MSPSLLAAGQLGGKVASPGVILPLVALLAVAAAVIFLVFAAKNVPAAAGTAVGSATAVSVLAPLANHPVAHLMASAAAERVHQAGQNAGHTLLNGLLRGIAAAQPAATGQTPDPLPVPSHQGLQILIPPGHPLNDVIKTAISVPPK